MAETDILNPQTGYWPDLDDNPNPSYGFTRKTNANALLSKTRLGSWYQRDNANAGYAFPMSFLLRPWTTMLRLKQFYEIGKNGYFTYIDYDGGGRHHVGRFTTEPNPVQMQNAKYSVQNLIFEEIPQARMLQYPTDFTDWGRNIFVLDDFLQQTAATQGTWTPQANPFAGPFPSKTSPAAYELYNAAPASTDFAQVQYVGWGFQLSMRMGANLGLCDIYVDGALAVQGLDLYTGTAISLLGYQTLGIGGPLAAPMVTITRQLPPGNSNFPSDPTPFYPSSLGGSLIGVTPPSSFTEYNYTAVVTMVAMPLDNHRVKVVPRALKNASSSSSAVAFPGLQVIV